MNCKEFKDKVANLFDTEVDSNIKAECEKHMAECPECKAYYMELKEAYDVLLPKEEQETKPKTTKVIKMAWMSKVSKYAASVLIFVVGFAAGWSHLFSTKVSANNTTVSFNQAIDCVHNVGSFQMDIFARTLPNENFQYLDCKHKFVKISVKLMRQNGLTMYRVEKDNGRTVVCDGQNMYMWADKLHVKGGKDVGFLDNFRNILSPENLLTMQKTSIGLSNQNKVEKSETDSTITIVTESFEKDHNLQELFENGEMGEYKVIIENIFTKNDGLLRKMKMFIEDEKGKHLVMYCDEINYNIAIDKSALLALPDVDKWVSASPEKNLSDNRLAKLQKENAVHAAQRILNSIISGDESKATEALHYYKIYFSLLHHRFNGCKASDFVARQDRNYSGTYVSCKLTYPDGTVEKRRIAIRNDNKQHIWILDGGL